MLRFVKGTLRRLVQYVFVSSGSRESLRNILFARSFKVVKQANELFCGMRHGNIVMLAFRQLLPEINGKSRLPFADIFCCIQECPTQISGAAFLHLCMSGIDLP